jgi:hypothetical protein
MWAHYAENHSGAVIEFSYIEKYDSAWGAAKPVRYLENMPRLADEDARVRRRICGERHRRFGPSPSYRSGPQGHRRLARAPPENTGGRR